MVIGIYRLVFPCGNTYIGQSADIYKRFDSHTRHILTSTAHGKLKEMKDLPILEILKECTLSELNDLEIFYINNLKPTLNTHLGGGYFRGVRDPEWKPTINIKYLIRKNRKNPVIHLHVECPWELENEETT